MTQSSSLLSPEDIASETAFEDRRKRLKEVLFKVQDVKTPSEHTKIQEGTGYTYPEFPYMLDLMNDYHPWRKEEISFELQDKAGVIVAIAIVTDIHTGEVRTGVDAHRITFKSGKEKSLSSVVDIGNDYKSASTEALRNAYSRFGVCADIYKKILIKPTSKEQEKSFNSLVTEFSTIITKLPTGDKRRTDAEPWIEKWITKFKNQNQSTANAFILEFREQLDILTIKLKENLNGK